MLKTFARTGALVLVLLAIPASAQAAGSPPMLATTQWSLSILAGWTAGFEAHATDPDGDAVTLSWAFDDGTTATGERPGKVWDTPGTHTATVTATDATGLTSSHTFTIEVQPNPTHAMPVTGPPPGWVPPNLNAKPEAALADVRLKLSKARAIPVRVSCAGLRCKGAVALARAGKLVGKASFSLRPDQTGTAYVRVSRLTAKLLRRRAWVPVVVTVAVDGADPATVTRTLKLRTH
jgi:PKD repeat protein